MKLDLKNPKKYELEYCDIYGNIFRIFGFAPESRELCEKIVKQTIKEIANRKNKKFDYNELLKRI